MITLEVDAGTSRVDINPYRGGWIERLFVEGLDLLVPHDVHEQNSGAFPMAPWAGRVRHGTFTFDGEHYSLPLNKPPHAIHGIARERHWNVDDQSHNVAALSTALDDPWPFGGRVVQRATLLPDALSLVMELHATDRAMPASCGWHPWWSRQLARGDTVELELHAGQMYARDDEGIPTGELVSITPPPWDDCFTDLHSPAAVLRWPGAATVTIETDCPCVVVYTEPEHAMCVEPQSGPPDALNIEPRLVTPDEPLVVHTTWRWELD